MGAFHSHHHHHTDVGAVAVAGALLVGGAVAATEGSLHPDQLSGQSIRVITLAFGALGALAGLAGGITIDVLLLANVSPDDHYDSDGYSEGMVAIALICAAAGAAVGLAIGRVLAAIICLPVICAEEAGHGCSHVRAICCPARDARVGIASDSTNYGATNRQPSGAMPAVRTFDDDGLPPSYQQVATGRY